MSPGAGCARPSSFTSLRPSPHALHANRTASSNIDWQGRASALRRGVVWSEVKEEPVTRGSESPAGDTNATRHPAAARPCKTHHPFSGQSETAD